VDIVLEVPVRGRTPILAKIRPSLSEQDPSGLHTVFEGQQLIGFSGGQQLGWDEGQHI